VKLSVGGKEGGRDGGRKARMQEGREVNLRIGGKDGRMD